MPRLALLGDLIDHGGYISSASPDCFCNGIRIARIGDSVICNLHGSQTITTGSASVKVNNAWAARVGDLTSCGATITTGSDNVLIDEG